MNPIQALTEQLARLPGIGPRHAKRIVYFLLRERKESLAALSDSIRSLQDSIAVCSSCFRFFQKSGAQADACSICRDAGRDHSKLMVVARDIDLDNIEKTRSYDGLYFVLGGTVPILEKEPAKAIRQQELIRVCESRARERALKEVILALNANPEGENTSDYVLRLLSPLRDGFNVVLSTLGRGLSTGSELEYSDAETLKSALKSRR